MRIITMTWISVKDKYPVHIGEYIVFAVTTDGNEKWVTVSLFYGIPLGKTYISSKEYFTPNCSALVWSLEELDKTYKVSHWMELPEGPKDEYKEKDNDYYELD